MKVHKKVRIAPVTINGRITGYSITALCCNGRKIPKHWKEFWVDEDDDLEVTCKRCLKIMEKKK